LRRCCRRSGNGGGAEIKNLETRIRQVSALREKRASDFRLLKPNEWMKAKWIKFTEQIKAGGEVWEYSTPRRYWNVGFGHAGYVVLQQGKAVAWMQTKMN